MAGFIRLGLGGALLLLTLGQALACETVTTARELPIDKTLLAQTSLNEESGQFVAAFKNGDLLIANFSQCGLGLDAHLYLHKSLSDESQRRAQSLRFLAWLWPQEDLSAQLKAIPVLPTHEPIALAGAAGDGHELRIVKAESPLFAAVIHYTWLAPEH